MKDYKTLIDSQRVPEHIAIIMDGNRRWAEKHSLPTLDGHSKGSDVIDKVTECAYSLGVKVLSLYAFSTENWTRPKGEIRGLWNILKLYVELKKEDLMKKGVRIKFCGLYDKLPKSLIRTINDITELTKNNKNITLNMCFNYGGRQDIINAVNKWIVSRSVNERLSEKKMEKYLLTAGLPEIDLMIRTSGEYRVSNFLIWQIAYSEMIFLDVLWPDFKPAHLYRAIYEFQNRERRFGGW
ncbi:MAG: di-trans,poly-cis-decaprenylcistransferase [Spirochaetes bacterium]|nr:di-trans,poly-cis-decaprenylcistransferase [Spirochaetota bacterium]